MTSLAAGMADVRDETLGLGLPVAQAKSIVHVFSLACVWLTFATSGIVLAELSRRSRRERELAAMMGDLTRLRGSTIP